MRSHKRLTLLADNAIIASNRYQINPLHVNSAKVGVFKQPKDVSFLYSFQHRDDTPIKDKLRYVRLSAGYMQKELADIVGIDRVTLTRLESGDVSEENMKTHMLMQIAIACGFERTFCCNRYHTFLALGAGKRIKAYRRENRLTQSELADKFNVALTTVKRWERDVNKPPIDILDVMFPGLIVSDAAEGDQ